VYTSTGSEGRGDARQEKGGGDESQGLYVVPEAATVVPFFPTRLLSDAKP